MLKFLLCITSTLILSVFCMSKENKETPKIRLLCIKHSREHMADGDAELAIQAALNATKKGLKIKVVGNHFVDGKLMAKFNEEYVTRLYDIETLTKYVKQYILFEATPGDTLIIFTIGHGFQDGSIHHLGKRSDVMKTIVKIAEENNQKVFWWQLSCYASAGLPNIQSLTETQKNLFCMFASSSEREQSEAYIQGKIMAKIFDAIADNKKEIDPKQTGQIQSINLKNFFNNINPTYGSRFHAKNDEFIVFGKFFTPFLPIIDRNKKQGIYKEDYIISPF